MINFIFLIFIRLLGKTLSLLNLGSGTALPGLLVEKYRPSLFTHYTKQLKFVVLVTGTNGKTTTKTLLSDILDKAGIKHITNRSGSNLKRGLLSSFISQSNVFTKLHSDFGVFEVEEATLPQIIKDIKPNILIVTNFFRDQLDAYGEVNKTREYVRKAIEESPSIELILNADDPMVSSLANQLENTVRYFSIPKNLRGKSLYEEHEGTERPVMEAETAKNTTTVERITINPDLSTEFSIEGQKFNFKTPGIYHVYNALAAIATAKVLNIQISKIQEAFKIFQPAFGRGEEISYKAANNKTIKFKVLLIKNPAGFTLTLNLLEKLKGQKIKLLLILNDKIADGRDVSWIWDADVEKLHIIQPDLIIASGTRAEDMALRVKYSGFEDVQICSDIKQSVKAISELTENGETIYVLPTYTAMNEFRKILGRKLIN